MPDVLLMHVPQISGAQEYSQELFVTKIAMGLYSISNELEKAGFSNEIINLGIEKFAKLEFSIADYIKEQGFKIVELSLHWHFQTYDTIEVARKIKEKNHDVYIVLGGYTASCFADEILEKFNFIDAVIKGEGEIPAVQLAKEIIINKNKEDLSSISNLHWKKDDAVIVNENVWIANEEELNSFDFVSSIKNLKNRDLNFHSGIKLAHKDRQCNLRNYQEFICCLGRGCPGNCTWCGGGFEAIKKITGRNYITLRSPQVVANEFIKLKKDFNIDVFYICFDPFPTHQDYLVELFEILGKELPKQIQIIFECFGLPTKEFIDALKENLSERSRIIISPELADEELRKIHKAFYFSNEEMFETLQYMEDLNIASQLYFAIIQNEPEKEQKARENLEILLKYKYKKIVEISAQPVGCFEPFAPWSVNPEKYGVVPDLKTFDDYYNNGKGYRELW